jgi:hypothetical protein
MYLKESYTEEEDKHNQKNTRKNKFTPPCQKKV